MHELFTQVLSKKDLSKAGDLFSVADHAIVNDLTEVVNKIAEITSLPDYVNNDNDQSVVEICITRVTSAIRETGSMEQHAEALVGLLESCLNHNLKPSVKDEDPPHAKISSDIISCIFLNYNKKDVMKRALPVAVKFLHKGNKELSRNMASYLSLAAIDNADLLSKHIQLIIDSIISGNYPLCRVLPQIYEVSKEPIHDHGMALVSLLPLCEHAERLALMQLFSLIAANKPSLLEPSLPQLCEYLTISATAGATMQVLLRLAEKRPHLLTDYVGRVKQAAETYPSTLCLAAQVITAVGKLSKEKAQDALNFVLEHLGKAERSSQAALLREATLLCTNYPVLFTEKMLAEVRKNKSANSNNQVNQTPAGVTIVKVGGQMPNNKNNVNSNNNSNNNNPRVNNNNLPQSKLTPPPPLNKPSSQESPLNRSEGSRVMISPRPRLVGGGDSRSTSRLHSSSAHRSMTRLNTGNLFPATSSGSGSGLHKSMTRLPSANNSVTTINSQPKGKVSSGGVTVTTNHSPTIGRREEEADINGSLIPSGLPATNSVSSSGVSVSGSGTAPTLSMSSSQALVTPRRTNTSVTIINHNNNAAIVAASQRISVFEPYPMRDTVQHFCEKHLDKIKSYMDKVSERIPLPAKCTIEERRAKKMAKLQFGCSGRGEHCLYSRTLFTMRSRNPRIWIHYMFLALQAKSPSALSSRHSAVTALKHCWDILKCENKPFVTLVTSAFPCARDQESVLNELRSAGFCDVFEYCPNSTNGNDGSKGNWGCFLCNHPDRAVGFLHDSQPVIEGQLKEKKGRWRMFRRWRTRYFTLSGARLEYKGNDDKDARPIDIHQIRSVKVSRGARNIPKAFEIFTGDNSVILKPKGGKNAEEWVQCLSVVVAHSQAKEVPATRGSSLVRTAAV
ncbi:ventricular zone expressed PH domain-containing protein melted isoform X2 [Rhodnius prolixus]|uniref:ventricular zone expressed PH domain-containing protein melted isoform X2 n=1 Tax=Rhodnius prolixus TaxID=13249 RepID=UPI003D18DD5C